MNYETIERHFTQPRSKTPFLNLNRIPRKIKKDVKRTIWVHWYGNNNDVRMWCYLGFKHPITNDSSLNKYLKHNT